MWKNARSKHSRIACTPRDRACSFEEILSPVIEETHPDSRVHIRTRTSQGYTILTYRRAILLEYLPAHQDQSLHPKLLTLPQDLGCRTPCWQALPRLSSSGMASLNLCQQNTAQVWELGATDTNTIRLHHMTVINGQMILLASKIFSWVMVIKGRSLLCIMRLNPSCKQIQTWLSVVSESKSLVVINRCLASESLSLSGSAEAKTHTLSVHSPHL